MTHVLGSGRWLRPLVAVLAIVVAAAGSEAARGQDVAPAPSPQQESNAVSMALVLAVDVSASINGERFQLQREGYASAVRHPAVLKAIQGSQRHQIALAVVESASANSQRVVVPWTVVNSEEDAAHRPDPAFGAALVRWLDRDRAGDRVLGGAVRCAAQ